MVHRLCELRPPPQRWADVMQQALAATDAQMELTDALREQVAEHAAWAIETVDAQEATLAVEQRYDELYVTAEVEQGELSGYIDHLSITPDAYHITDYKTGDVAAEDIGERAEHHRTQLVAYALALHQQGSGRRVRASLLFTAAQEVWEVTWTADELDELQAEIEAALQTRITALVDGRGATAD
jgi:ATP-dependent helicase/nuclease subunit A